MTPLKSETLDLNPAFIFNLTYPSFDPSSVNLEKALLLGKIEDRRRSQKIMRWLADITESKDMNLSKLQKQ